MSLRGSTFPAHTLLAVSDAQGNSQGHLWYDPHGSVLTSTLPVTLTQQLFSSQGLDSRLGLVYHGNGRWYDPSIAHSLQPDPFGGVPHLPQTLNRYAVPTAGSAGVAQSAASLSALGLATSVAKNAGANTLSYAAAESLGPKAYDLITISRMGSLRFWANNRLLRRAGVDDLFIRVAGTGGRGRSAQYTSGLVREVGEDIFEVAEGPNAGRFINLWKVRAQGSGRWRVGYGPGGPFEVTGYSSAVERLFLSTFWRDFAWNAGIAIVIETPFFILNVWNDPYLTPQQKGLQGVITTAGIGGAAFAGALVGGLPGAVVCFSVGVTYELVLVPLLIRPVVYHVFGVDPYARTRRLAPLE